MPKPQEANFFHQAQPQTAPGSEWDFRKRRVNRRFKGKVQGREQQELGEEASAGTGMEIVGEGGEKKRREGGGNCFGSLLPFGYEFRELDGLGLGDVY